jgi:hypothetical protein
MKALCKVLLQMLIITGLAFSAASVGAQPSGVQQLISQLLSGVNPQWAPIPGAPGVQYAPNANADLFRYENRYYYQHEGRWYRGRNMAGPWQRVQNVPRSFHQIEAPYFRQPPGWAKGNKTGWKGDTMPPGQRKKYDRDQQVYQGQKYKHGEGQQAYQGPKNKRDEGQHGQKNQHDGGQQGQKNKHDH